MKTPTIFQWYQILRQHHQFSLFQAVRGALWLAKGEMLEAVDQFYADDCVHQEGNQPPRTGSKKGQKEYLSNFFKTVKTVNALTPTRSVNR